MALTASRAHARYYDGYRSDYVKGPFCSVIAGACAADRDFGGGFFQNPAALTAAGGTNFNYDYGYVQNNNLEQGMKKDNDVSSTLYMAKAAFAFPLFGMGLSYVRSDVRVSSTAVFSDDAANAQASFKTQTQASVSQFNLPMSFRLGKDVHLGFGVNALLQSTDASVVGDRAAVEIVPLSRGPAFGLTVGFQYARPTWTIGAWARSPMTYYSRQNIAVNSSFTRFAYTEEVGLNFPYLISAGLSWTPWEDQHGIFIAFDSVGVTPDGFLLSYDNFAAAEATRRLTEKGRHPVIEPRFGVRLPFFERKISVSLGSYIEKSRWTGYSDVQHFTAGIAYRFDPRQILGFKLKGPEVLCGVDLAENYSTLFFTYR